jgi:hypothetical protein
MRVAIEAQLMRDWSPRSRPTVGYLNVGDPEPSRIKLVPGAAAVGTELMIVTFEGATRVDQFWVAYRVGLSIEGTAYPGPRPGVVFLGLSDTYTDAVHFPRASTNNSHMFGGWHSLLVRMP